MREAKSGNTINNWISIRSLIWVKRERKSILRVYLMAFPILISGFMSIKFQIESFAWNLKKNDKSEVRIKNQLREHFCLRKFMWNF